MSTVSEPAVVRHGKTRLYITINDDVYLVRRSKQDAVRLKKVATGAIYFVGRCPAGVTCTCPDNLRWNVGQCKHVGAVLANRLLRRPRRKAVADV